DGAVVIIPGGIVLGQAHVALGVYGVVIAPVGYRGHGDRGLERVRALGDAQRAHVAPVAPALDADTVRVHVRQLPQPPRRTDLVLRLVLAQLPVGDVPEVPAPAARAPAVHARHDIALLGKHLVPQKVAPAPAVQHGIAIGAAVLG